MRAARSAPRLPALAALATTLCASAQTPLADRVAATLDRARPALLHHLRRVDLGELALLALAAVHDGVPRDDAVMARALTRLQRAEITDTYGLSLRLMVLAELPDLPGADELAARDAAMLQGRQTTGGFSYGDHDGWWDLSNTQYAALGLRAAHALGQPTPRQSWQLLYDAVRRMQHGDGGFTYRPGQGDPVASPSMTAAGIAVLEVAAQMLELGDQDRERHDARVDRAWGWLGERAATLAAGAAPRLHYFLYGLERAAILGDRDRVGDIDWYAAGAEVLCDRQLRGGGWWGADEFRSEAPRTRNGHPVDTAFAVLFLRRAFRKVQPTAPVTGPRTLASAALAPTADDDAIAAAAAVDAARGRSAFRQLLFLLHSDEASRRRAAAAAVSAIAGVDFGLGGGDPAALPHAVRAAELWWLRQGRSAAPAAGADADDPGGER